MQRHVDRGTSKMVLMSIIIFQLMILFPVLAYSKNYLYDSQAAFVSKGCTRNYPVVWIDTAKWISNTELTYDEVRRLFSEAFRSVWRDSGADLGFSFAHDGATNSCYYNNDCSSGYFCDTFFQKCMPFYGVEITTAEFYSCQYAAAVLPYGSCGIKITLNTNHACDFYKRSWLLARHFGICTFKHEVGHVYGLYDLYCFSACSSDNDCQTHNPHWHCSINDPFWSGPGSNCCRYIGDNPTISLMSYDLQLCYEMSWADVSTLRRDFGQREQPVHTRHFYSSSWHTLTNPPARSNYSPAVAYDSKSNKYCLVVVQPDTYNSIITYVSNTGLDWSGPYSTGSYSTHGPAVQYFPDIIPGDGKGHFLMVHIGNRKWDGNYQMYYQTSTNCQNWSAWQAVPHSAAYPYASSVDRPQIAQVSNSTGYLVAGHCYDSYGHCSRIQRSYAKQWRYDVSTKSFTTTIQEDIGYGASQIIADLPFGFSYSASNGYGLFTAPEDDTVDKKMRSVKIGHFPNPPFLFPLSYSSYNIYASEFGYSSVYYYNDPTNRPWWNTFVPVGINQYYPFSTNSNRIYSRTWDVPLNGSPIESFPLIDWIWSGVGMCYVARWHEVVAAYSSGEYD